MEAGHTVLVPSAIAVALHRSTAVPIAGILALLATNAYLHIGDTREGFGTFGVGPRLNGNFQQIVG